MGEYTLGAVVSAVLVVLYELLRARTGVFRDARYWITMAICFGFMVPVNGWYTKLSAPIVLYDPAAMSGTRAPWDIPVEDFVFGFTLLTLTLIRWLAVGRSDARAADGSSRRPSGGRTR
jgi:lycopene cyclase domain-containing protein